MPYRIKVRLVELGKRQIDLIKELRRRGYTIEPASMSRLLHGIWKTKTAEEIAAAADKILTEWEAKVSEKHNGQPYATGA